MMNIRLMSLTLSSFHSGHIFIAGGIVTITLSHFWTLQVGVILREMYVIGGDVLVGAGVAIISGCTFTNNQLFLNGNSHRSHIPVPSQSPIHVLTALFLLFLFFPPAFGVGFQVAVLGGVFVASGVTFTFNVLAANMSGAG